MRISENCLFDPLHTFECGQCFRWNVDNDGNYIGIACGKICMVRGREIICESEELPFWHDYFDFDTDYQEIERILTERDFSLEKCIKFGKGIRILKQDVWETIISFIISANNNIPRIRKIIETMCRLFGDKLHNEFGVFYSFPSAERLSQLKRDDLAPLRAGYRDLYILDAANKIATKEVDIEAFADMPTALVRKELMKIKGIGKKVADCIMLFSLGRHSVFPTDVWIKRILSNVYNVNDKDIESFVCDKYGEYAGIAQQYLYYYYRSKADSTAEV